MVCHAEQGSQSKPVTHNGAVRPLGPHLLLWLLLWAQSHKLSSSKYSELLLGAQAGWVGARHHLGFGDGQGDLSSLGFVL